MEKIDWQLLNDLDAESRQHRERYDLHLDGDLYGTTYRPGLSKGEMEDARFWAKYRRGLWHVEGEPGGGKGSFVNMVAYKMKYYFGMTPVLDFKPCSPFGYYEFFDTKLFVTELEKIAHSAKITTDEEIEELKANKVEKEEKVLDKYEKMAEQWAKKTVSKFRNSVLVLDEYPRYRDKRNHNKPINILLSHLETVFRHYDILIIGIMTNPEMIDFRAFEHLTMKCFCMWDGESQRSNVLMKPVKYIKATGSIRADGDFKVYPVDIYRPHAMMCRDDAPLWISQLGRKRINAWLNDEITAGQIPAILKLKPLADAMKVDLNVVVNYALKILMALNEMSPGSMAGMATAAQTDIETAKNVVFELAKYRYIDGLAWKDLFNSKNDVALSIPKSLKKGVMI